jgi:uncharacterized protein (DUF2336 family)
MQQMATSSQSSWIPVREVARRLEQDPNPKRRAEVAAILGTAFSLDALSQGEQPVAIQIFERLARDVEVDVRRALSEHIKSCPLLPRDLARRLAEDVEAVAVPILRYSTVLSDDDLVAIVAAGSSVKQIAIAERETVSDVVADALVCNGDKPVVRALLANNGAEIGEESFQKVLDGFGDDGAVQTLLVDRPKLPITVTEQLVSLISGALKKRLISRHGLPEMLAEQLVEHGRERALLQEISPTIALRDLEVVTARLHANGALTPTLLLRALCTGNLDFFIAGAAALVRVPTINVRALLHNFGEAGFRRLYEKTGLPEDLRTAFWNALEVTLKVRRSTATAWEKSDTAEIVNRLVRSYDYLSPDGLESVLCQLHRQCLSYAGEKPVPRCTAQGSPYLDRPLRPYATIAARRGAAAPQAATA